MDLLTQGLLGAATAQSASTRRELRMATLVGLTAGMLPDADILIRSPDDPLLFLDFHRHFTHALVFVPIIALVASALFWPWLRRRMPVSRIYLYALLGASLAGALDACTSYGTRLLWPLDDQRVAWSIVSIIDPVITLALAIGLVLGSRTLTRRPARLALLAVAVYLGAGAIQHQRANATAQRLAQERGHVPERIVVKPTIANLILWRSLYVNHGRIHVDGLRLSPFGEVRVYVGESAPLLAVDARSADDPRFERLRPALVRFARFADGLLVRHPQRVEMIGDARFAMLPTSLRPLWGIAPAANGAADRVEFVTDRGMSPAERSRFFDMLFGTDEDR